MFVNYPWAFLIRRKTRIIAAAKIASIHTIIVIKPSWLCFFILRILYEIALFCTVRNGGRFNCITGDIMVW